MVLQPRGESYSCPHPPLRLVTGFPLKRICQGVNAAHRPDAHTPSQLGEVAGCQASHAIQLPLRLYNLLVAV